MDSEGNRGMASSDPPDSEEPTSREKETGLNILLLGETGVGKSTFINAFANYLAHDTLEDAAKNVGCLIPSYFSVYDEKSFQMKTVKLGKADENENIKTGNSATQYCKCYVFSIGDIKISLIDTPGIGDTRGVEKDGTNMRNLLSFIAQYKKIHAICILLQQNNSRVSVVFKYCILQLLTHLDKSASRNIIFLFTNARGTFYKPGDTAPALLEILKAVKNKPPYVDIKFTPDTFYCFDNEAFRFLVATFNNIDFSPEDKRNFEISWERSVVECKRLVAYILTLPPQMVQDTISINKAKTSILMLTRPLGDIAKTIDNNKRACDAQLRKIAEWKTTIAALERELYIPSVQIVTTILDKPKTVCGDPSCCDKVIVDGGIAVTHYRTTCHNPCYLNSSDGSPIGDIGLLDCKAFNTYEREGADEWCKVTETTFYPDNDLTPNENGEVLTTPSRRIKSETCNNCGHSFSIHLHILYEASVKNTRIKDDRTLKRITTMEEAKEAQSAIIARLKAINVEWSQERYLISKNTAKFACFLLNNALTPFNDAFEDYLLHLISNETSNIRIGDELPQGDSLKQMLGEYRQEKEIILDAMNKPGAQSQKDISSHQVEKCIEELCNLKHCGPQIREQLELHRKAERRAH